MTNEVAVHGVEPWRERLGLPAYRVVDAARYCGLSPRDIRAWVRGFVDYDSATGARTLPLALSYYELVEVAFVATFFGVGAPLSWIRRVREHAVQELRSEYPFVQESWRNEGHLLLHGMGIGDGPDLGDYLFTTDCCREAGWSGSVLELFEQSDYEYELALVWHLSGRGSPVRVDPRVSFGSPMVRGIPTSILRGRWEAGKTPYEIHEDFDLSLTDVLYALEFEGIPVEVDPR